MLVTGSIKAMTLNVAQPRPALNVELNASSPRILIPIETAPAPFSGGAIGGVTPSPSGKSDLVYRCVPIAALESEDIAARVNYLSERSTVMATVIRVIKTSRAPFVDMMFRGGQLLQIRPAESQCRPAPVLTAQPVECPPAADCPKCKKSFSWWWIVAIGVAGVWAGSRYGR